ncbi:DUF1566 domain-containing protein [Desulfonatronum sp. SC1]|uniref:Lcl domain-containing protein n=1 Tax=Desulfonatronum sp. SC1 TaxID=2109626 RepID=UPI000D3262F8|nr:DUF1566 domain-containing protein [Desulfonatronum sp. SC1]PTN31580.1 hypothetical protein C6366_17985 [Desulfonatronum sp. SC1]
MPAYIRLSIVSVAALLFCFTPISSHAWHPLNDTGIQFCGGAFSSNNNPCTGHEPQGQDAHYGRDAAARTGTLTKVGAGEAGFDFTKISNSGHALPATAQLGSGPGDWACTRDNVTGIMWEVKVNNPTHARHKDHRYTWFFSNSPDGNLGSQGLDGCNNTLEGLRCNTENYKDRVNAASLCGYTDWRVPSIKELESITHLETFSPTIDTTYFPNTSIMYYWSSSPNADNNRYAWVLYFKVGSSYMYGLRGSAERVLLARGGHPVEASTQAGHCMNNIPPSNPDSIYTVSNNGNTVTDIRTGLMWKTCPEGQTWTGRTCSGSYNTFTWIGALAHAESHVFANHRDWRLPNVKELRSLVDECRAYPSINETFFPNSLSQSYWTSSPSADNSLKSKVVVFIFGQPHGNSSRSEYNLAWLVRGGQTGPSGHTLIVNSIGASSVPITGNPSSYGGTTNYNKSNIPNSTQIALTAPTTSGNANFTSWTGCNTTNAANRTCTVIMNANKTVTANYEERQANLPGVMLLLLDD